jgi:hypothetical protein
MGEAFGVVKGGDCSQSRCRGKSGHLAECPDFTTEQENAAAFKVPSSKF